MTPYALCSWLLNRRGVRAGATLNDEGDGGCDEAAAAAVGRVKAPTLRFEPSAFVPREAVSALVGALEEMCGLLHDGRLAELLGPVLRQDRLPTAAETAAVGTVSTTTAAVGVCSFSTSSSTSTSVASFSSSSRFSPSPLWSVVSPRLPPPIIPSSRRSGAPVLRKAVFLSHLIDEHHAAALDPALRSFLSPARRAEFLSESAPLAGSIVYHEQLVTFGGGGGSGRRGGGEKQILGGGALPQGGGILQTAFGLLKSAQSSRLGAQLLRPLDSEIASFGKTVGLSDPAAAAQLRAAGTPTCAPECLDLSFIPFLSGSKCICDAALLVTVSQRSAAAAGHFRTSVVGAGLLAATHAAMLARGGWAGGVAAGAAAL